jgi:hypothetical protein
MSTYSNRIRELRKSPRQLITAEGFLFKKTTQKVK